MDDYSYGSAEVASSYGPPALVARAPKNGVTQRGRRRPIEAPVPVEPKPFLLLDTSPPHRLALCRHIRDRLVPLQHREPLILWQWLNAESIEGHRHFAIASDGGRNTHQLMGIVVFR